MTLLERRRRAARDAAWMSAVFFCVAVAVLAWTVALYWECPPASTGLAVVFLAAVFLTVDFAGEWRKRRRLVERARLDA